MIIIGITIYYIFSTIFFIRLFQKELGIFAGKTETIISLIPIVRFIYYIWWQF